MKAKTIWAAVSASALLFVAPVFGQSAGSAVASHVGAAQGSTQYVIVVNKLANVKNAGTEQQTKSTVFVVYYDGTGTTPSCWTDQTIGGVAYNADPEVAGAGGDNKCGKPGISPPKIVKVDINPQNAAGGAPVYEPVKGVVIDPTKRYNFVIVEEQSDARPVFDPDSGGLITPGKIKIKQFTED